MRYRNDRAVSAVLKSSVIRDILSLDLAGVNGDKLLVSPLLTTGMTGSANAAGEEGVERSFDVKKSPPRGYFEGTSNANTTSSARQF